MEEDPKWMRALQVHEQGSGEVYQHAQLPVPQPGPGELRVQVASVAIGMPDVFLCRGTYRLTPTLPFVPGQEFCVVVRPRLDESVSELAL
jgi:NADPH2:quinone reductase